MISVIFIFVCVFFGFIMGSFLNVVSLRFNTGKSLNGRSQCFSCSRKLSWYELIPVFSWLIQGGRCRNCSSRIPREVFLSEVIAGVFFGIIGGRGLIHKINLVSFDYLISTIFLFVVFGILMVILFYDVRHKIIPDSLSYAFAILSFVGMFFFGIDAEIFTFLGFHIPSILNMFAGFLLPLPFVLIWLISRGKLIGLGDPKLMIGMGFLLGLSYGMSAIFLAFWIGSLFALILFVLNKIFSLQLFRSFKKSILKVEIPFAPFLVLGTLLIVSFGFNFLFIY